MSGFDKGTEQHMIVHMNEDHVDAMYDYCRIKNIDTTEADPKMVAIDNHGFDIQVNQQVYRFYFPQPCKTPEEVRQALVTLAKQARSH